MFSNSVFSWMLLCASPAVCPYRNILRVLLILFHVIYPFSISVMFYTFPYSSPKLFCSICLHLLISLYALSTYLVELAEFSFVEMSCSVCIVCPSPDTFGVFLLLPMSFDFFLSVVFSDLSAFVFLLFFFC